MKRLLSILLAAALLCAASAAWAEEVPDPVGVWALYSITDNGETVLVSDLLRYMPNAQAPTMEFREDGSVTTVGMDGARSDWRYDAAQNLIITGNGGGISYIFEDDRLKVYSGENFMLYDRTDAAPTAAIGPDALTGVWHATAIVSDGMTFPVGEGRLTITFREDGTYEMVTVSGGAAETAGGTYTLEGGVLTLDGVPTRFSVTAAGLRLFIEGMELVMVKE